MAKRLLALFVGVVLVPACTGSKVFNGAIRLTPKELTFTGPVAGPNPPLQQVHLRNLASGIILLNWTATSDRPWLHFNPVSGTTGGETDSFNLSVTRSQGEAWTTDTSLINVPPPRETFGMVWTGSEVLIWGGAIGGGPAPTNDGYRYDPGTDTWSGPMSTVGAPSARWGHVAVWTGTEMIVWGGVDSTGPVNNGYRYNPVTDTWSGPISAVSAPSPRRSHKAVWTGSEMIVWGGADPSVPLGTGARYDPALDLWTPLPMTGAPTARWSHVAVWTGTEMVIWGGFDGTNGVLTGAKYRVSSDSWVGTTSTTATPPGMIASSVVWTGTEMIVFGGQTAAGSSGTNTGGRYDPAGDSWQATTTVNAPSARWGHGAVWIGAEMILWGGAPAFLNSGRRYVPSINLPVGTHTATFSVSDPGATNSPQTVAVTFVVDP